MNPQYSISVLIPCHSILFLEESIISISQQTLSAEVFEVILVIDRVSKESVTEILSRHLQNYRIIESKDPGIVAALNLGLSQSKSKYIARLDEDDLMAPDRLRKQLLFLEDNLDIVVVGGQIELIDESGKSIGFGEYPTSVRSSPKGLLRNSPIAHPASMYRRESVLAIEGYRSFLAEDWDLWVRLSFMGGIANLDESVLKYRVHPKQLSREKMFSHSTARRYVGTSYFALRNNLQDSPDNNQSREDWLIETSWQLRKVSKDFRKFDRRVSVEKSIKTLVEKIRRILK